ncbi:MAG: hypothetical protein Pars2KO_05470 [Parasphingorhabdus sp.]
MATKNEEHLITREQLLRAAIRAFAREGFRGASVRNIANSAGVNFPLVTYHFGSKEKLWLAVAKRTLTEIIEMGEAFTADENASPDSNFAAYLDHVLTDSTEHRDRRIILGQISARRDNPVVDSLVPLIEEFLTKSTARIQRLLDNGFESELPASDIQMILRGLLASNASAPQGPAALFGFESNEALVNHQVSLLMRLFKNA